LAPEIRPTHSLRAGNRDWGAGRGGLLASRGRSIAASVYIVAVDRHYWAKWLQYLAVSMQCVAIPRYIQAVSGNISAVTKIYGAISVDSPAVCPSISAERLKQMAIWVEKTAKTVQNWP
jgi:hypothetical protein